jgi:cell division protein FtsB
LFYSAYICIITYLLLTLFLGPAGYLSSKDLQEYSSILLENLDELDQLNRELQGEVEALTSDSETIRLYSRELGYYREGEQVIRFRDKKPQQIVNSPGRIISREVIEPTSEALFRAIALSLGLLFFIVSALYIKRNGSKNI